MGEEIKQTDINHESEKQGKVYWHDSFFAAIQLELDEYADSLTFEEEHHLSKQALKIDVVIIKNENDTVIKKNIGRIFKRINICEYKSETDNLSIADYTKVIAYGMLYSSFYNVPLKNITITFVVTPKPTALFDYVKNEKGLKVEEMQTGIYYTHDNFPIQIIESKILSKEENLLLKNLRSNLTTNELVEVIEIKEKYGSKADKMDIYLARVLEANKTALKEVLAMGSAVVKEIINEHIRTSGIEEQIEERGREQNKRETALEMINMGYDLNDISKIIKKPIEWVQSIAT